MGASAIVAVRKAVVSAVSDLSEFADVEVMYSFKGTTSREFVYTREGEFEHAPASMRSGRNYREEIGGFELVIWVECVGGTPEEAAERALDLGQPVEEWVADNKNGDELAVDGLIWILVQGAGSLREAAGDQSSYAELVYPIRYHARLT